MRSGSSGSAGVKKDLTTAAASVAKVAEIALEAGAVNGVLAEFGRLPYGARAEEHAMARASVLGIGNTQSRACLSLAGRRVAMKAACDLEIAVAEAEVCGGHIGRAMRQQSQDAAGRGRLRSATRLDFLDRSIARADEQIVDPGRANVEDARRFPESSRAHARRRAPCL